MEYSSVERALLSRGTRQNPAEKQNVLPGCLFRSIAEQGNEMQIGKELQGLPPQTNDPELMPF
jgi:hypothetical protein